MKFFGILAFAAAVLAEPYPVDDPYAALVCEPPSYICKPDFTGWLVCNVEGRFLDGGSCEPDAWCEYIDGLPYCIGS
ncbi:hypothetical protein F4677DRAFT_439611 [Hypoxylon crocopeplum]|nr:hypothetical protein F4677DRAFT_439611 [Hypoxylon crocopeplum]